MKTLIKIITKILLSISLITSLSFANNQSELAKIDTSKVGKYKITYEVSDSFGNKTTKTRIVNVIKNEKPILNLKGLEVITMFQNETLRHRSFLS